LLNLPQRRLWRAGPGDAARCLLRGQLRHGDLADFANAGSADIAGYQVSAGGDASLIAADGGIAGTTDGGPIDLAGAGNGQFLYVEAGGAGAVDEFSVNSDGTLTSIGSITGLSGTGIEGIVAS